MEREELLVETLVALADTLVDTYDVIDFMHTLAERCVELLDVSEAGIMLADPDGNLRHIACSSEQMRLVELLELQVGEGPCFDAYTTHAAVACDSLQAAHARWPRFAPHAREGGFEAVSAVPMRLRSQVIGALNLFSTHSTALTQRDLAVAQAMADIATIGILQERAIHDSRAFSAQLEVALDSRIVIEQAKGIVAERNRVDVDEAFQQIRHFSRIHNRLLSETARQIIVGALLPAALTSPKPSPRHSVRS
jgi:transcriptional regulator with GAF, ATPase, and Fis domain